MTILSCSFEQGVLYFCLAQGSTKYVAGTGCKEKEFHEDMIESPEEAH